MKAMLTATVPNPDGTGHTIIEEVLKVALTTVSPNWHFGTGAGAGSKGSEAPTRVTDVLDPEGPALGEIEEKTWGL